MDEQPTWVTDPELAAVRDELAAMINFDYNVADIRPADQTNLDRKAAILQANPAVRVRISGHADDRGSEAAVQQSSEVLLVCGGEPGQLGRWGEKVVAGGVQCGESGRGERDGLDPSVVGCGTTRGVTGAIKVVDHGRDVGGVAVHDGGELAHRPGTVRVDGEQSA